MLQVNVIPGDITKMSGNIVIPVNSKGDWFDSLNLALRLNRHYPYHVGLIYKLDALDDDERNSQDGKIFPIEDVIFVIDDHGLLLSDLFFNTLEAIQQAGYQKIAIPTMRISPTSNPIEVIPLVLRGMKKGITEFKKQYPDSSLIVDIVVDNDSALERLIKSNI